MFIATLFTIAKTWKQHKLPLAEEWLKKMWCLCMYVCVCMYIYNGILLSHKKNEIMLFAATWMDLEVILLREISQTVKYHMLSTYMWNLKKKIQMFSLFQTTVIFFIICN